MTAQLDSVLAGLASRAGTSVEALAPEMVKVQGAWLGAEQMASGVAALVLVLCLVGVWFWGSKHDFEDTPMPVIAGVPCAIGLIIAVCCFIDASVSLTAYNASPIGYTVTRLIEAAK